jgi:hypothetical protein
MTHPTSFQIALAGTPSLRDSAEIAGRLRSALSEHDEVVVDLQEVTSADIGILQVLVAAERTAVAGGKTLRVAGADKGAMQSLLLNAGLAITAAGQIAAVGGPSTLEHARA